MSPGGTGGSLIYVEVGIGESNVGNGQDAVTAIINAIVRSDESGKKRALLTAVNKVRFFFMIT
jgi:hypothetical protein